MGDPTGPTDDRAGRLRARRAVAVAASLAVALTFVFADPFGLSRSAEQTLGRFANWTVARIPALERLALPAPAGPPIAVLLIDDGYLEDRGLTWPLDFAEHGALWRLLAQYRPRAVFIDFVFLDRRGGNADWRCDGPPPEATQALWRGLEALAPAPVFLGAAPSPRNPQGVLCELLGDAEGRPWHVAPVDIRQGPLLRDRDAYALFPARELAEGGPAEAPPSPAAALYAALCGPRPLGAALPEDCRRPLARADEGAGAPHPVSLIWSIRFDPVTACLLASGRGADAACEPLIRGWDPGSDAGACDVAALSPAMLAHGPRRLTALCPPLPTLSAGLLRGPSEAALARDGLTDPRRRMLSGAVVFVGGHFRAIPDLVDTPLHERLPGVYVHALALDMLIRFGAGHKRPDVFVAAGLALPVSAYAAFCVLALFAAYLLLNAGVRDEREWRAALRWAAAHLALGGVLIVLGFAALDIAPGPLIKAVLVGALPKAAGLAFRREKRDGSRRKEVVG